MAYIIPISTTNAKDTGTATGTKKVMNKSNSKTVRAKVSHHHGFFVKILLIVDQFLKSDTTSKIARILLLVLEMVILVLSLYIYCQVSAEPLCSLTSNWNTKPHAMEQTLGPILHKNITEYINQKRHHQQLNKEFLKWYQDIDNLILASSLIRAVVLFEFYYFVISRGLANFTFCQEMFTVIFWVTFYTFFGSVFGLIGKSILERPDYDVVYKLWKWLASDYKYLVAPCPVYPLYYYLGALIINASAYGWGFVLALHLYQQPKPDDPSCVLRCRTRRNKKKIVCMV